ncbi:MAG TPA: hypothetical protein VJV78_36010 [Polyangiales bacterium]|nr:hypothetical protein [Polyangiales bacterium]
MKYLLGSLLLMAAVVSGCSGDPPPSTQIVVVVDSDMSVPDALDRIAIDVSGVKKVSVAAADLSKQDLPRSLGLVHTGGPLGPVRVRARGFLASAQLVERLAIVSFEQDKTLELRLPLSAACSEAELDCGTDMTCDRGKCVTAEQDDLPLFKGTVKGFDVDDVEPPGGDAGPADGGPMDSGSTTNEKPVCTISAPADGASFAEGAEVSMSGSCQDPESGPIRIGLSWESTPGGMLGNGARINVSTLAAGTHMISLCARDPEQASLRGCATISITITAGVVLKATITELKQGDKTSSPFSTTAPLSATGSGMGEDPLKLVWTDSLLGPLGEGESVTLDNPPKGKHTWTLTVTDGRMQSATDSRSFVVREPGKSLLETVPSASMRFDVLAAASDDRVYAAGPAQRVVYAYDGSSSPATALDESKLADVVRDIALDEQLGYAYVATKGFLICKFDAASGIDANSCNDFKGGGQIGNDDCTAVERVTGSNNMQYLLVGTLKGLIVTSPDSVVGSITSTRKLNGIEIRAIARAGGTAWLATTQGLYSFDPVSGTSQRYGALTGAPSDALTSVAVGSDGALWVGSTNGIGRFVPSTHSWTLWRAGDAPAPGLAANDVRDVMVSKTKIAGATRDIVWIATSAGVSRFDPALPSFTTFTQEDGLPNNSVRALTQIRENTKVIATDSGAVVFDGI